MQEVSSLYREIISGNHTVETRVAIGERGALTDHLGRRILFGGKAIRVNYGTPNTAFKEDMLFEGGIVTTLNVFPGNTPTVGGCVCGEIDIEMMMPMGNIPKRARIVPYVRLTDGTRYSEWIQKGVFYADTREKIPGDAYTSISIHGYDAMLRAEADYPGESNLDWPAKDIDVVREIAKAIGVGVDSRTVAAMTLGNKIQLPTAYSMREVLGYIAGSYAGCFVITDIEELLLIQLID